MSGFKVGEVTGRVLSGSCPGVDGDGLGLGRSSLGEEALLALGN
jgi:hypothetical protein